MKPWFVAYFFKRNSEASDEFANGVISTYTDDFSFMRVAQELADANNFYSVSIVNWKKMSILEYEDTVRFKSKSKPRDVGSN